MSDSGQFQMHTPLGKRQEMCVRMKIKGNFPEMIPVICERHRQSGAGTPYLTKIKFLCSGHTTVGQLLYCFRRLTQLSSQTALFVFVNEKGTIPATSTQLNYLYDQYHNKEDGFLYLSYSSENVFGAFSHSL